MSESGLTERPSVYTMKLFSVVKEELKKIRMFGLWILECFLLPFLSEMAF